MTYAPPPPPPPPPGSTPPPGYAPPPPPPGSGYYGPPMPMRAPNPQPARRGGGVMIGLFVGALVGIAVLVGIIVLALQPPPPTACGPGIVCPPDPPATLAPTPSGGTAPPITLPPLQTPSPTPAGQTPAPTQPGETPATTPAPTAQSGSPPFVSGTVWRSETLGYSFEYDEELWELLTDQDAYAQLRIRSNRFNIELNVLGYSGDVSVEEALQDVYAQTDTFVIGRAPNNRPYDALVGAGIGYIRGDGGTFLGTFKKADGTPGDPVGITVMAATNGRITLAVIVLVTDPDTAFAGGTLQKAARGEADSIVKTVLWEAGP